MKRHCTIALLLFAAALAVATFWPAAEAANPRNRQKTGHRGRTSKQLTGRQASNTTPTMPSYVDSARLILDWHALKGMYVEPGVDGAPETFCAADGNAVGEILDLSPCQNEINISTGRTPTLASDATMQTFGTFDGSLDFMYVQNSQKSFTHLNCGIGGAPPLGTIAIRAKVTAGDGTTRALVNNSQTGAGAGLMLRLDTSNKIQVYLTKTGGTVLKNFVSATTMVAADGWCTIVVVLNGDGTGNLYLNNAAGTKAASEAITGIASGDAAGTAAATEMTIGASHVPGNFWNGGIASVHILPTAMSGAQRAEFLAWNPARTTAQLVRKIASDSLPSDYSMLRDWYDGNGTTYFYQDTAKATPVTADGQSVRNWANRVANINRDLLGSGAAGTYPLYKPTDSGGIQFDGSNDNLTTNPWSRGGDWHAFILARNDDTTNGSHLFSEPGGYLVITSTAYADPPYAVIHSTTGFSGTGGYLVMPTGFNVIEVAKYDRKLWVRVNGIGALNGGSTLSAPVTAYTNMGTEIIAGWQLHGVVCEWIHYAAPLPKAYADRVVAYLGNKWSVAGMGVAMRQPKRQVQVASLLPKRQDAAELLYTLAP